MHREKPYFSIPIKENKEPLVKLNENTFVLMVDKKDHRSSGKVLVRSKVAKLLILATRKLPPGFKFKIFDAWRSEQAQQKMINRFKQQIEEKNPTWNKLKIEQEVFKFAAPITHNPAKPPPHNTGGAIDLAIVDNLGKQLRMGREADKITERSSYNYYKSNRSVAEKMFHKNRLLLRKLLTSVGFAPNDNEWWHFDYGNQRWAYYYKKPHAYYGQQKQ